MIIPLRMSATTKKFTVNTLLFFAAEPASFLSREDLSFATIGSSVTVADASFTREVLQAKLGAEGPLRVRAQIRRRHSDRDLGRPRPQSGSRRNPSQEGTSPK